MTMKTKDNGNSAIATAPAAQRRDLISMSEGSKNIGFTGAADFALTHRVADCLSKSELVPDSYRGEKGFSNCVVALELAARLGISWLAVMQNLYVVYGRPAWMSSFLIANVNGCGRFHSLRFDFAGEGKKRECTAWTCEKAVPIPPHVRTLEQAKKADLPVLDGTPITWAMVEAEGWLTKKGSKWATMPDQMFRYRAASFWSRVYAPELTMGIRTMDELEDVIDVEVAPAAPPVERTSLRKPKDIPAAAEDQQHEAQHVDEDQGEASEPASLSIPEPDKVLASFRDAFAQAQNSEAIQAIAAEAEQLADRKYGRRWLAQLTNDQVEAVKRVEGSGE